MTDRLSIPAAAPLGEVDSATTLIPSGSAIGLVSSELSEFVPVPHGGKRTAGGFAPTLTRLGRPAHSFNLDFYDRIHLVPPVVNLGNLTQQRTFGIILFNAYQTSVYLTEVRKINADGLELETLALPLTIKGITDITLTVTAFLNGPAVINASFIFVFSEGTELTLHVTGLRIVTFPMRPNWREPVSETLAWSTDILEARDGSEQRVAMLSYPRWRMKFLTTQTGEVINRLDSLLVGWAGRRYSVPVWWYKTRLNAPVRAGDEFVSCETDGFSDLAVLWSDETEAETVEIAEVQAGGLKLAFPVQNNYPAGFCLPARLCFIRGDTAEIESHTGRLLEIRLEFELKDPESSIEPAAFMENYNGIQIVPYKHNWTGPSSRSLKRLFRDYDAGLGLPSRLDIWEYPKDIFNLGNIVLADRREIDEFKAWLVGVRGRAEPFYWRLDEDHLEITEDAIAGDSTIRINSDVFGLMASAYEARKVLAFELHEGPFYVEIAGYRDNGVLIVSRPLSRSISRSEVKSISFLVLSRLDIDEITFEYRTDSIATVNLALKGVAA